MFTFLHIIILIKMHDMQIHRDFLNIILKFFAIINDLTWRKWVWRYACCNFDLIHRKCSRAESDSPSREKKIEKKLREKNRWIQGVRADLDEVSELSRPGGALGVERESPAPVINTELWVNCELFLQIWATHAGASPPVSPAGSLHEAASLSHWRRRFFSLFVFFYPRVFFSFLFSQWD